MRRVVKAVSHSNYPTQYWDLDETELPLLECLIKRNRDFWTYTVLDSPPEWYWSRKAAILLGEDDKSLGYRSEHITFSGRCLLFEPKDSA